MSGVFSLAWDSNPGLSRGSRFPEHYPAACAVVAVSGLLICKSQTLKQCIRECSVAVSCDKNCTGPGLFPVDMLRGKPVLSGELYYAIQILPNN